MDEAAPERTLLQQIGRRLGDWPAEAVAALHRMAQRMSQAAHDGSANASPAAKAPDATRGAPDDDMTRLAGVIRSAQAHGERASNSHDGASQRIDAALQELEQLRSELAAVIDPALLASDPAKVTAAPAPRARSAA